MSHATPQPGSTRPEGPRSEVPGKVARAAADKQLGALVFAQRSANPVVNLVAGIALTAAVVGVATLVAWAAVTSQLRALGVWACCIGAVAVVVFGFSVAALFAGSTATYLYTNGIVGVRNLTVQAVSWPEVDELWLWKTPEGILVRYYVITFDGRKIPVLTSDKKGDKTLGEQLQRIVRQLDRPVKDNGPYVRSKGR
jgi:hypothetical protein